MADPGPELRRIPGLLQRGRRCRDLAPLRQLLGAWNAFEGVLLDRRPKLGIPRAEGSLEIAALCVHETSTGANAPPERSACWSSRFARNRRVRDVFSSTSRIWPASRYEKPSTSQRRNVARSRAGKRRNAISIESRIEGESSCLILRDNGPGIESKDLDKIFDPFFTTKEIGKGMGLGLSICYRIIQECDGRIEVRTEPGKFCEFTLRFPIKNQTP